MSAGRQGRAAMTQVQEPADLAPAGELWQGALLLLRAQVTQPMYETYLRGTKGDRFDTDVLVVTAPSDFHTVWLANNILPRIRQALAQSSGRDVDVRFEVEGAPTPSVPDALSGVAPTPPPSPAGTDLDVTYRAPRLNDRYTFETFVEGENNRLALAACVGAAEHPGERYNPIFIYGGVGLGKTHLMHAMGHVLIARDKRVIYVTSEQFTNDFVGAIRTGRNDEFRSRYRSADLLLIDDIQFIAGKEGTMEEFFHTFNDLHSHGRQIVITSDQPPKRVSGLEDRLISRFEWGLIADVQPPGQETRLAILQRKARSLSRDVPETVLSFIAERVRDNVRELEGTLNRVVAYADLTGVEISLEIAARALGDQVAAPPRRRAAAPEEVLDAVGQYFQVQPRALAGKGRDARVAHARQVAMHLLKEDAGKTLTEIGRILGKRDHTTVLYGCRKIEEARVLDADLRRQLQEIRDFITRR